MSKKAYQTSLDCDEITQVTWRRILEELICCGNNFVFDAFQKKKKEVGG